MVRSTRLWLALAALLCAQGCCGPSPEGPRPLAGPLVDGPAARPKGQPLKLASLSANVLQTNREVGPVLRYLEWRVGRGFDLLYCRSYRDMVVAVEERRCEFAWLSPQTYVELRPATGCVPLVQQLQGGHSSYRGLLVVGSDSAIDSIDALKGKRLALADHSSTSGYAYPMAFFRSRGKEPGQWFSRVEYSGSHEGALMSVLRGLADAAAVEEPVLERLKGKIHAGGAKVLAVTGEIPNGLIVAQKDVPAELRDAVTTALLEMGQTKPGRRIVAGLARGCEFTGFGPVSDRTYDGVRQVRRDAGLQR
ncbi:MAG: phosphate/phosphite/phosphonate ABC transporter substrate-binding protein [Candidatus Wallbacteria bacterium]|nr:phosphate/phosphite/phosphonate ABC transporter substrate-binding protein [Candidatus Wallbacteria bacterium]